jgi:hypothetical protein
MKRTPGSHADAERIIGTALNAFGRGAGQIGMHPQAVESFRNQFISKVYVALEQPDWEAHWRREKAYLIAYAGALGERASALAAEEQRRFITQQDITFATTTMRGYMPIAGRWCPM